jgi:hypothetical protein
VLHAKPISSILVWSTECLARSKCHAVPHYLMSSIPLLPHPPQHPIKKQPPSVWEAKFHTHTKKIFTLK